MPRVSLAPDLTLREIARALGIEEAALRDALPDMHPEALVFMRADGRAWNTTSLGEQFRLLVEKVFPCDKRQLRDFRRSGTVEAFAGGADAEGVAAKMGNSIDRSNTLWKTYNPVSLEAVRRADMARGAGRQKRRERD